MQHVRSQPGGFRAPERHIKALEIIANDFIRGGDMVPSREGPKFGRHRSSAEGFGRMFGSAT